MMNYEINHPYQYGNFNSIARHVVPPAEITTDEDKRVIAVLEAGVPYPFTTDRYGDARFLAEVSSCQPLKLEPVINNWQYHQKGLAQEILPFLYVGPMAVARDPKFVQSNAITMLLAVRDGKAAAINPKIMDPLRFASAQNLETATFDIFNELDMIQRFRSVIKQMNDHLLAKTRHRPITCLNAVGGKILVFCEAGDKRSAALVVLFFMVVFGLPGRSAIQAVQSRRYGININGDLHHMIQTCEDVLRAEREVAASSRPANVHVDVHKTHSHKRSIDQYQEEDEDMDLMQDGDDTYRFGTAPFKDDAA